MHSPLNFTLFLTAIGIIVSLLGTWWTHQQRATFDMIDGIYGLCHTLHGHLRNEWRLSHLFCIGDEVYYETRDRIAKSPNLPKDELQVKERLFAVQVFIIYEQAFYQWQKSSLWLPNRRKFLHEMLAYFTERLLRNPRLVAYLESDRTGRTLHLERDSMEYLYTAINATGSVKRDDTGPFDYPIRTVC